MSNAARFGLGEGLSAPMRPVASPSRSFMGATDPKRMLYTFMSPDGKKRGKAMITQRQREYLRDWLKKTQLKNRLALASNMIASLSAVDVDWDFEKYLIKIEPTSTEWKQDIGDTWKARRTNVASLIGSLTKDFIEQRLEYKPESEEFARIYIRIGEAVDVANFLLQDTTVNPVAYTGWGSSITKAVTQTTFPNHPYKYNAPYGFWHNNTINKANTGAGKAQEGKDFKNCFGYPTASEKNFKLLGMEGDGSGIRYHAATGWKGNVFKAFENLYRNLWALSTLISEADINGTLTLRQRRAMLVEKLSTYLPGMVELDDGRALYSAVDTPIGKKSTLDLDVAPEGLDPGYIPGIKAATGWFRGLEFLVEDSLLPYKQIAIRPGGFRDAAPKDGVTTESRRTASLAYLAAEAGAANAASAAAAAARAGVEAQRRELDARREAAAKAESGGATPTSTTSTGDTGTGETPPSGGSNKGKLLLGVAAAAAGIYFMNKG
jgi:hypothetical protein